MKPEDAEEYTQALGQIAGGAWRQIALARRLGVPQALGLTVERWVNERLGGYIRMNIEDRRVAVAELAADGHTVREIGEVLGMSKSAVARDASPVPNGTGDSERSQDEEGSIVPNGTAPLEAIPESQPAPLDAIAALAMSERQRDEQERLAHSHRTLGTGENEWYTPAEYVELARGFLGGIDLDPASSDFAQRTVQATSYYTISDDGLQQEWSGRIWLNPPYAQPAIAQFVRKMVDSAGPGVEAVMLTHNYTDTEWFQTAARAAAAICFTRGRIAFESPSGERAAPTQGQAFFYFGPRKRAGEFADAFDAVGLTVRAR